MANKQKLVYSILTETETTEKKNIHLKISNNKGMYIIHRALTKQLNNQRQGTANTKTRNEVKGGGRKPWKQKGTGKARAGSIRSPLWKGGGVIFGPKTKNYNKKINKKEQQIALTTILSNKFRNTFIIQGLSKNLDQPNTKLVLERIQNLNININKTTKILIIVVNKHPNLYLSIRNLPNIELINANQLNVLALLKAEKLLITIEALNKINEIFNG